MKQFVVLTISSLICLTDGFLTSTHWDYFTFSQAWPPGTCVAGIFEKHTCAIPKHVKTWVIHGLWPSRFGEKGPFDCDSQMPFDINKLATIRKTMETFWPNLYNDTAHESFWSHEWTKHGTCSLDLKITSSELDYFNKGLELNQLYNITSMLLKSKIVPSTTMQYSYEDFINAIKSSTGFEPVIECAYTKLENGTGYHVIDQIDICLDKEFKPISCDPDKVKLESRGIQAGNGNPAMESNGALRYMQRSDSHFYEHQSNCPQHYNFNYPPIPNF